MKACLLLILLAAGCAASPPPTAATAVAPSPAPLPVPAVPPPGWSGWLCGFQQPACPPVDLDVLAGVPAAKPLAHDAVNADTIDAYEASYRSFSAALADANAAAQRCTTAFAAAAEGVAAGTTDRHRYAENLQAFLAAAYHAADRLMAHAATLNRFAANYRSAWVEFARQQLTDASDGEHRVERTHTRQRLLDATTAALAALQKDLQKRLQRVALETLMPLGNHELPARWIEDARRPGEVLSGLASSVGGSPGTTLPGRE